MTCINKIDSILYITHHFPPETGAGATRAKELSKRWSEAGEDVTVLTTIPHYPDGEVKSDYRKGWIQRENQMDTEVIYLKTLSVSPDDSLLKRGIEAIWFAFFATLVGLSLGRFDIVLATCPQPLTGITGWTIARIRATVFIYEVRDLWPESLVATGTKPSHPIVRILDIITDFIYNRADAIVVVAEGMVDNLSDSGVNRKKIYVHRNGTDPNFYQISPSSKSNNKIDRLLNCSFVVSYIGSVGKAQKMEILLDVAELFHNDPDYNDLLFAVVGFGNRYDVIKKQAKERSLKNIKFYGKVPKKEVPAYLEASDVSFVHLKKKELFKYAIPSKIYEAMIIGNPIVLGVEGEAAQIIRDGNAGIPVKPEDPDSIASAIKELYDNQDLCTQLGENGTNFVRENLTWDLIADEYRETFISLISR